MIQALKSISASRVAAVSPGGRNAAATGFQEHAWPALRDYGNHGAMGSRPESKGDEVQGLDQQDSLNLGPEARAVLSRLKQRDAEVRAHEQAHIAAGGQHVSSGPQYEYQEGPDGRQYAVGGHVAIDASEIKGDPKASAEKARQVRRAALAPGEPSAQDRAVAAKAASQEQQAERKEREQGLEEASGANPLDAGADQAEKLQNKPLAEAALQEKESAGDEQGMSGVSKAMHLRASRFYNEVAFRDFIGSSLAPAGTGISFVV